ncbi:MAG: hypothetical protein E7019_02340 [Alphaproteobacteria bacterium]|nr:hypothetical protein [Alphaproteobacteria bacterium]
MENTQCTQNSQNLRVCVSGGHRSGNETAYVDECYKLGAKIAKMGFRLDYGFSNSGVMGAVAKGVLDNWLERKDKYYSEVAPIVGVTTKEYFDLYEKDDFLEQISEVVLEDTLENRKIRLLEADIVVFAPGGVGTLDELAYDCVAMQDGFLKIKPFIIYNIDGFFYHILEFLKSLVNSGFANPVPFIVVDNSEELEIAFRLLKLRHKDCSDGKEAYAHARQLAYDLPYFIKKKTSSQIHVEDIIEQMENINLNGSEEEKNFLKNEIELAYLEKEIERMYDRLAKTGRDTAVVSEKLTKLKKRKTQAK